MSTLTANLTVAGAVLLTGLSFVMLVIGLMSYGRLRASRLLWVSAAFLGLFIEGLMLTTDAYASRSAELGPAVALNLAIVSALYVAVLRP